MRRTHDVKSWPAGFTDALVGRKRFELRKDDRDPPYQTGDQITLHEFDPTSAAGDDSGAPRGFTGRRATFVIGYVERSACIPDGWCGFELISAEDINRMAGAVLWTSGR